MPSLLVALLIHGPDLSGLVKLMMRGEALNQTGVLSRTLGVSVVD